MGTHRYTACRRIGKLWQLLFVIQAMDGNKIGVTWRIRCMGQQADTLDAELSDFTRTVSAVMIYRRYAQYLAPKAH